MEASRRKRDGTGSSTLTKVSKAQSGTCVKKLVTLWAAVFRIAPMSLKMLVAVVAA